MQPIDELAVNTIRFLAVDAIEKAKSGHPGLPMGGAAMAYALWTRYLKHAPSAPDWPDRDRFVLSAGHGSMLLYALLHLSGYDLSLEEIKNFRQWGSKTPGHPEYGLTPGVEVTTGPLGQGFAAAVGMAIAERRLAAEFNRPGFPVVDHYTYIYAGDGCMMEGISSEAASLAGHLKLNKLICLYDDNRVTIDGSTDITFTEDVGKRFEAYGWQVLRVEDGNDIDAVAAAIGRARESDRPTLIMVRTEIGYGSPHKQGKPESHGAPLGAEEARLAKERLGWPLEPTFHVPPEVRVHFEKIREGLEQQKKQWDELMSAYREKFPEEAARWDAWHSRELPRELPDDPALWEFDKPAATRAVSGQVLQVLARYLPNLMGGSADLNASTKTYLKGRGDFQAGNPTGSNIAFGVREHAMGTILAGMALHGGLRPFGSTFLVFSDYMKPSLRLAALMGVPVVYVFTHDSIAVGEDGPTHQPVEHLANLRSIPNLDVLRPADGRETAAAWLHALGRMEGPTALVLSRQDLPPIPGSGREALRGAYVVGPEKRKPADLIIIAGGSELNPALQAKEILEGKGFSIRVVSMVSREIFERQEEAYRRQVLPDEIDKRLVVEAALPMGWERYAGSRGRILGITRFGASAPGAVLMEKMGFTAENIARLGEEIITEG
ncbi:MAG: transketolase [Firmicutes bacterium]|nr:transketolase [Bacillota bacterium]HPU02092.1 transketolase [Bacillota bacterium]